MKKFTKIAIILAGVFVGIGLFSVIGAVAMGVSWKDFTSMVNEWKFNFGVEDIDLSQSKQDNQQTMENYHNLDVEFGYGVLEITYGDVEQIQIKQENVDKYQCYIEEETLYIEGNLKTNIGIGKHDGQIVIVVPNGTVFDEVDLEFGAGKAKVSDLIANKMDIELGAGEMDITKLDVNEFNVETGAGKLYAELVGKQTDYSYNLECGIGQLKIGDSTYTGLGTEQKISNPGAERFADIECGVGEIEIEFQK